MNFINHTKVLTASCSTFIRNRLSNLNRVNFHSFTVPIANVLSGSQFNKNCNINLTPISTNIISVRGMKAKGKVRRLCVDCYMIFKDRQVFNYCKTHPRHNQMSRRPKDKLLFNITEKTHGRVRPY